MDAIRSSYDRIQQLLRSYAELNEEKLDEYGHFLGDLQTRSQASQRKKKQKQKQKHTQTHTDTETHTQTHTSFSRATDEAGTQDVGTFQLETGGCYERGTDCRHLDLPAALTYGVLPQWDLAVGWGEQFERHTGDDGRVEHVGGCDDLSLSAKWLALKESAWLPAQTIGPTALFPVADDGKGLGSGETDYDLTWMASKTITERTCLHVNAGFTRVGDPSGEDVGDVVHYGVAADCVLTERFQAIAEAVGEEDLKTRDSDWRCQAGFRYGVADRLSLVFAAGSKIAGREAPDALVTAGLIWVFDAPWRAPTMREGTR